METKLDSTFPNDSLKIKFQTAHAGSQSELRALQSHSSFKRFVKAHGRDYRDAAEYRCDVETKVFIGQFGQRSASKEEVRHLQEEHEDRAGDSYENEYTASQNIIQVAIFFPRSF